MLDLQPCATVTFYPFIKEHIMAIGPFKGKFNKYLEAKQLKKTSNSLERHRNLVVTQEE